MFGKITMALFLCGFGNYIYKKFQYKKYIVDVQNNDIYALKDEIEETYLKLTIDPQKLFNNFNVSLPKNGFIQIFEDRMNMKDPHIHYYKLKDFTKKIHQDLKLNFLLINSLSEDQINKLVEILGLQNKNELYNLSYVLTDSKGNFRTVLKSQENLEFSKRFLNDCLKINSLEDFNHLTSILSDESIHILFYGGSKESSEIIKNFYFNSCYFGKNSLNVLQTDIPLNKMFHLTEEITKDELLIFLNKNYYEIPDYNQLSDKFFFYDMNEKKLIQIKEFLHNIDTKEEITNIIKNFKNLILVYKFKFNTDLTIPQENMKKKKFQHFTSFLQYLIDPEINKEVYSNIPKRIYYTNNMDISNYYKIKFVTEQMKTVFVHLNKTNLKKNKIENQMIINMITEAVKSVSNNRISYIITDNPNIAKSFHIIPHTNENITIRFIDFGNYVYYDEKLNEEYKLIKSPNNLENINKNLLFHYKTKYDGISLNLNDLIKFLNEFTNLDHNKKEVKPHYLEYNDLGNNEEIVSLNGQNFKKEIIDKPGKKIIISISDNCVGCVKIKKILEKYSQEKEKVGQKINDTNKNSDPIKVFQYDVMNESIFFKKIKKSPILFFYNDGTLLKEVDINQVIDKYDTYENAVFDQINTIFKT